MRKALLNPVASLHSLFLLTPSLGRGMAVVRLGAQSSHVEFLSKVEWTEAGEITLYWLQWVH